MKTITILVFFSFIFTIFSVVSAQSRDTIKAYYENGIEKLDDDQRLLDIEDMRSRVVILDPDKPKIFYNVEQMPVFPGGESQMISFVKENLQYPINAKTSNIEGKVIVLFVVDENGVATNPKILKSLSPECDNEAIRILKLMPKWEHGTENGEAVSVYYILPVIFRLN